MIVSCLELQKVKIFLSADARIIHKPILNNKEIFYFIIKTKFLIMKNQPEINQYV